MNALAELIQTASPHGLRQRRYARLATVMRREFHANESGDWTDAAHDGNLSNTSNWSGGVVPNGSGTANFEVGTTSLTSGSLSCATINIRDGFGGDVSGLTIGTDSAALSMAASTKFHISNAKCKYIKIGGAQGILDLAKLGNAAFYLASGSVTTFQTGAYCGGSFEIEDDVELTYGFLEGSSGTVKGDSTSPVAAVLTVARGVRLNWWREYEAMTIVGVVELANAAAATATSRTVVVDGGTLICKQSGNLAGTSSGFLHVMGGGTLDASQANYDFTIARLIKSPRAKVLINAQTVTVSATVELGGSI